MFYIPTYCFDFYTTTTIIEIATTFERYRRVVTNNIGGQNRGDVVNYSGGRGFENTENPRMTHQRPIFRPKLIIHQSTSVPLSTIP